MQISVQSIRKGIKRILAHPFSAWLALFLGLFIRIRYAMAINPEFIPGDAYWYYEEAKHFLLGKGLDFYWPPGLIMFLVPHLAFWGLFPVAVVSAMLIAWLLVASAWRRLAGQWLAPHWVRIGYLLLAIWPAFIHQSVVPLSHMLIAWALIASLALFKGSFTWWKAILLGIYLAIMALTRPGTLALVPVFGLAIYARTIDWQKWLHLVISLSILSGSIYAWESYAHQQTGRWIRINDANAYNFYLGNNPWTPNYRTWWLGSHDEYYNPELAPFYTQRDSIDALPPAQRQRAFQQLGWEYIGQAPGTFMLRVINRAKTFLAFDTLAGGTMWRSNQGMGQIFLLGDAILYLGLGLLLIWLAFSRRSELPDYLLKLIAGLMIMFTLPYLLAFSHPTYHLPLLPLVILLLIGYIQGPKLPSTPKRRYWKWGLMVLFLLIQIEWIWQMADRLSSV